MTMDLHRLIRFHRGDPPAIVVSPKVVEPTPPLSPPMAARRTRAPADPSVIPPGALLTTLKIAGVALGYGRTTISKLADSGRLTRIDTGAGVRITVASIRALAGNGGKSGHDGGRQC